MKLGLVQISVADRDDGGVYGEFASVLGGISRKLLPASLTSGRKVSVSYEHGRPNLKSRRLSTPGVLAPGREKEQTYREHVEQLGHPRSQRRLLCPHGPQELTACMASQLEYHGMRQTKKSL